MFLSSLGLLSLAVFSHASSQTVLGSKRSKAASSHAQSAYAVPYDDGLFTPIEDLSVLSFDSFTTLSHPSFPEYSVRIKRTVFECEPDAKLVHLSRMLLYSNLTHCTLF